MEKILKDKSKTNLFIDIIMLILMMAIAGIGLLMKYVLVAGYERNAIYGNRVDLAFLGLTRHEWGTIHLIVSLTFLGLLILHTILHWNMIVCIFKKMLPKRTIRIALASILTIFILLLVSFPLFVEPEIIDKVPMHKGRNNRNNNSTSEFGDTTELSKSTDTTALGNNANKYNNKEQNSTIEEYEVYGSQTLQFVADKYSVPASTIAADLGIPVTLAGERLGRLKKQYSFTMDDVKSSISKYKKSLK